MPQVSKYPNPVIESLGGGAAVARMLGITREAVSQWRGVIPAERVIQLAEITGLPAEYFWRPQAYEVRVRQEWTISKKPGHPESTCFASC